MDKKMNEETIKALIGSISKWEGIVEGAREDDGQFNCPLCAIYWLKGCYGCPLGHGCEQTPYDAWKEHQLEKHQTSPWKVRCKTCKEKARKELDFLRGLLEDGRGVS